VAELALHVGRRLPLLEEEGRKGGAAAVRAEVVRELGVLHSALERLFDVDAVEVRPLE
jgi:hypothetical protein